MYLCSCNSTTLFPLQLTLLPPLTLSAISHTADYRTESRPSEMVIQDPDKGENRKLGDSNAPQMKFIASLLLKQGSGLWQLPANTIYTLQCE